MYKATRQQTQCDVINDVKLFPTIYCRIYCCKFLSLSNQTTRYKSNGIRICIYLMCVVVNSLTSKVPYIVGDIIPIFMYLPGVYLNTC